MTCFWDDGFKSEKLINRKVIFLAKNRLETPQYSFFVKTSVIGCYFLQMIINSESIPFLHAKKQEFTVQGVPLYLVDADREMTQKSVDDKSEKSEKQKQAEQKPKQTEDKKSPQ